MEQMFRLHFREFLYKGLLKMRSHFHFTISSFRNIPFYSRKKMSLLVGYLIFLKNSFTKKKKNFSQGSLDFDLIPYQQHEKHEIVANKCPKIFYMTGITQNDQNDTDNHNVLIQKNFENLHSKFKELDLFSLNYKKNIQFIDNLKEIVKLFGYDLYDLLKIPSNQCEWEKRIQVKDYLSQKPFLLVNKYNDIKFISQEEFIEISKVDATVPFFEKLSILTNKHNLLMSNEYDYNIVINLETKDINYNLPIFRTFRKMFHLFNFHNVKFYVATPEHSKCIDSFDLKKNNIYLIRRNNMLIADKKISIKKNPPIEFTQFEDEGFVKINLTEDLSKLSEIVSDEEKAGINFSKVLLSKGDFIYYLKNDLGKKQGIEVLNLYFKDIPYYLAFANLKDNAHKEQLREMMSILKNMKDSIDENFALIVLDNEKVNLILYNSMQNRIKIWRYTRHLKKKPSILKTQL